VDEALSTREQTCETGAPAPPLRLAVIAAEPVFYYVPLYRQLASDPRVDLTVIFASDAGVQPYDAGFGGDLITWDVDLLSGYRSDFVRHAAANRGARSFLAMRDLDVLSRIWRGHFDAVLVVGYAFLTLWYGIAAARLANRPVLIREDQTLLERRPRARAFVRAVVLRVLFSQAYALSPGSNNRDFFMRYGMDARRIFRVPHSVDNEGLQRRAAALAPQKLELREKVGIPADGGPVALFVGKLTDKKRPTDLLEAFTRVRARHRCALIFVGEGPLRAELEERAKRVPDVHVVGFLNRAEIADAFAAADMLVVPSAYHETWGLVVNEAMNFSLPVIVSHKVGCARDLVQEGVNGLVFPARDVGALAGALERLISDPKLRARLGAASRERISGWTYEAAAEGVISACFAACRRRTP
jgi:glycosyltransferase involved in cell wall biosynthesis